MITRRKRIRQVVTLLALASSACVALIACRRLSHVEPPSSYLAAFEQALKYQVAQQALRPSEALAALDRPAPTTRYTDVPIADVIDDLADRAGIEIPVHWSSMEAGGFDKNTPITIAFSGEQTLAEAVESISSFVREHGVDCRWCVLNGRVRIGVAGAALVRPRAFFVFELEPVLQGLRRCRSGTVIPVSCCGEQTTLTVSDDPERFINAAVDDASPRFCIGGSTVTRQWIGSRLIICGPADDVGYCALRLDEIRAGLRASPSEGTP